ncbi:MAG: leucine-rich repeat protein, partial [Clostridia bacterium]|nr:leucine-rich repeat protein [Clostridia bacterium]
EIGQDTFCECSALETVELPSTVKTLDYRAFKDCTGKRRTERTPYAGSR